MATDDERREVARRLRGLDYADLQESLICAYLDALGIEGYADWVGIAHRLADLIEPPHQCPYYDSLKHRCSFHDVPAVDCDALLALADEMEEFGSLPARHPGVRVLHNEDFSRELGYARRIRKALGVE